MGTVVVSGTTIHIYQSVLRNTTEQRGYHLHRVGSLKSHYERNLRWQPIVTRNVYLQSSNQAVLESLCCTESKNVLFPTSSDKSWKLITGTRNTAIFPQLSEHINRRQQSLVKLSVTTNSRPLVSHSHGNKNSIRHSRERMFYLLITYFYTVHTLFHMLYFPPLLSNESSHTKSQ
jgi:hypothetical protein